MLIPRSNIQATLAAILTVVGTVAPALAASPATPAPDYDFQWATITHPNNPGYDRPTLSGTPVAGLGTVPYEYRIAKMEVTTAQWVEFVNTFSMQPDFPGRMFDNRSFVSQAESAFWGAFRDSTYTGPGVRYAYEGPGYDGSLVPVMSISWRDAALYCNWLHNGKQSDPASLLSGAYDTSTWGGAYPSFTDALTHEPGSLYWIPTLNEWLKASFWDPDKFGPGQPGWWQFVNSSDTAPVPGYPSEPGATTAAGLPLADPAILSIPLGAYPEAQSPWELLDTAGGGQEWNEQPYFPGELSDRGYCGSSVLVNDLSLATIQAHFSGFGSSRLNSPYFTSVRIASAVPSTHCSVIGVMAAGYIFRRKRDVLQQKPRFARRDAGRDSRRNTG
jgi:hypothetical protein